MVIDLQKYVYLCSEGFSARDVEQIVFLDEAQADSPLTKAHIPEGMLAVVVSHDCTAFVLLHRCCCRWGHTRQWLVRPVQSPRQMAWRVSAATGALIAAFSWLL